MLAYVFPGQGSQFPGMGKDLYNEHAAVRELFERANDLLGYRITDIMFEGSAEDLKQTEVTQPAVFLYSLGRIQAAPKEEFEPDMVAGHSLGELTAMTAVGAMEFEDGLALVKKRAEAMQEACEQTEGTMAAVLGLADEVVEEVCDQVPGIVVPANYNCPGQLVISGEVGAVEEAVAKLKERGARRAVVLAVGGAFHSPLMEPAKRKLEAAIANTPFDFPKCPVYQNVTAEDTTHPLTLKRLLMKQLTGPVRWTQIMYNMIEHGMTEYIEVGSGKTLRSFMMRVDKTVPTMAL